MSALKLAGLIAALMISAALTCSAAMLATSLLTGMMSPSPMDILLVTLESGALLGLLVWLRSTLRIAKAPRR